MPVGYKLKPILGYMDDFKGNVGTRDLVSLNKTERGHKWQMGFSQQQKQDERKENQDFVFPASQGSPWSKACSRVL